MTETITKWTLHEIFHLDAGGAFWLGEKPTSVTRWEVRRDGAATGITREEHVDVEAGTRTDVLTASGGEQFDMLHETTAAIHRWCEMHRRVN